jgi:hypothetical protein
MPEFTDDQRTVHEIAALFARGLCRWRKNKGFQQSNYLKQLDNLRVIGLNPSGAGSGNCEAACKGEKDALYIPKYYGGHNDQNGETQFYCGC